MDFHRVAGQFFFQQGNGKFGLIAVKRLHHIVGQAFQTAVLNQRRGNSGTEARGRKVHHRIQRAHGFYHFGVCYDDAGAHAG